LIALVRRQNGVDGPVLVGLEDLDLPLAVAHEPQRDRLHAARGPCARQFAPEHRREREADEVVERPAREIGRNERRVELARLRKGRKNRLLCHGVEGDALDLDALFERLLLF